MQVLTTLRTLTQNCLRPLARSAARAYVAGDTLAEAMTVADRLCLSGLGVTLGYWDGPTDSPRRVADEYLACVRALAGNEYGYVSVKAPAIDYSTELLDELVTEAMTHKARLHFDSLGIESVAPTQRAMDALLARGGELSCTLPGRWRRSVADAQWAIEREMTVRVVKGQWPDPLQPDFDPRTGFLLVIDALAGRARHVAVASHDVSLAAEAVRRLQARGTSCELELLYGLPMRRSLKLADELGLGVRAYVPYGESFLPYAMRRVALDPRIAWRLLRDAVKGLRPAPASLDREPALSLR
jgi:proline dehydrogenase